MSAVRKEGDQPARILVVKSRYLGDVLLTGPLFSTLRKNFQECRISVLVKAGTESILAGHPHVHEVLTFPEREAGESLGAYGRRHWRWWRALRARRFDWSINTTDGDRGHIVGFVSGAGVRIGFLRVDRERWWRRFLLTHPIAHHVGPRHAVLRHLDLITWHSRIRELDTRVYNAVLAQDLSTVREMLLARGWDGVKPVVQIHPTARWRFKSWTATGMAQVIDWLHERGCVVVVTGSAAAEEMANIAAIVGLCRRPPVDLGGCLTVKQVVALTALCRLYLGVDTAMMHIAASLDVPVLALFGPSMPFEWGPWPNGWDSLTRNPYGRQGIQQSGPHRIVQKDWPCVPCHGRGCNDSHVSDCLEKLDSAEVIAVLQGFLPGEVA
ncbi:MAG: putative lipopolysaccharide heptosyltransferase III [Magnetococcales bacterium]|nr:putative lipopolysaccharide heptosyltransferase III [Magnetococcales bacterium]